MQKKIDSKKLLRVIDANYNRAKEGLRVCEDLARFVFDNKVLTARWKKSRHALSGAVGLLGLKEIVGARNTIGDVGRVTIKAESERKDVGDIFYANCQRVKESVRVLEEFLKLMDAKAAERLKRLRYEVYDLEKKTLGRM